jgi:hypothetical protein
MKIYNYNPSTFEFLSESDANLDPLEGKPLVPANATLIKNILATQKNKAIIFNQDLQKWEYIPDFRNKVLANKQNGSLFTIEKLNIDPANLTDYTDILPSEGNQKWDEVNKKWFSEKPLAMGTDLVRFVNQTTESTLDDFQAFGIVSKLKDFLLYCQQGRCNPFTKQTFNNTLQTLDKAFANGQKELIVGLVNKWAKTVRFEE